MLIRGREGLVPRLAALGVRKPRRQRDERPGHVGLRRRARRPADGAGRGGRGGDEPALFRAGRRAPLRPTRPAPPPMRSTPAASAAWIEACARLLRRRGRLALIQRADKLPACLAALEPGFGAIRITPVHPRADKDATRVVITAVKTGRPAPPQSLAPPPSCCTGRTGASTERAERAHRGGSGSRRDAGRRAGFLLASTADLL